MTRGLLGLLALSFAGCIPAYKPPTQDEPHALLKMRRTYDTFGGTHLRELLLVDGHRVLALEDAAALASTPRTDPSMIHPLPATFEMHSLFFHHELRTVRESYQHREPHMEMERYDCSSGSGASAVHRTCSRSVTKYRYITKYRTVTKQVEVSDGECGASTRFTPAPDGVYLLQYSYQDRGACSLSCFQQTPNPDGTFTNARCPAAPPP